ncbi:MAG: helix-turn-helix domain-containing protein [Elusimicrobiota bacterium]
MAEQKRQTPDIDDQTIVNLPADIGTIVRMKRKKSGLTQAMAAALCNVGTRFLSDLENGKPTIHLGKTMRVLKNFGIVIVLRKKTFADAVLGPRRA